MLTQQELKELLEYSPETGLWRWKVINGRAKRGWFAGNMSVYGYRRITVKRQAFFAHRLAWLYVYGTAKVQLDHINRNRGDNRINNLRAATDSQNTMNAKLRRDSTTGFRGVYHAKVEGRKSLWHAHIVANGIRKTKNFETKEEAIEWRQEMEARLFGEFAADLGEVE